MRKWWFVWPLYAGLTGFEGGKGVAVDDTRGGAGMQDQRPGVTPADTVPVEMPGLTESVHLAFRVRPEDEDREVHQPEPSAGRARTAVLLWAISAAW